ncbi:MAG TPA: ArsA-related P-loop ATPase [Miltoncostaeaceae bacterium]|nr:ArsA-related P-loop ATPase [Miltoncostaeaceae bacterium]
MIAGELVDRRVLVSCGAGGVGKTTISAALGLGLAAAGRRTVVVTIDPARRLAAALGMAGLSDEPRQVDPERARAAGVELTGEMWALQLDAKATFDRLVARHAPTPEARDRILANRIYGHLSSAVAGSQEYMAVERLHELVEEDAFESIVLDTPPARNALDFLAAPERMARFIEGRALRLLLRPGGGSTGIGWRALHAGSALVLSVLERLTGAELLREISEFLGSFEGMYTGFHDRADAVRELLKSDRSAFLVVTGPEPQPAAEAVDLWHALERGGYPVGGLVVNRTESLPEGGPAPIAELGRRLQAAGAADPEDLARRAARTLEEERMLAVRDLDVVEGLRAALGRPPVAEVPLLEHDPVEVAGLARVTAELFGT